MINFSSPIFENCDIFSSFKGHFEKSATLSENKPKFKVALSGAIQ